MLLRTLEERDAHRRKMYDLMTRPPQHNGESIKNDGDSPRCGCWIVDAHDECPPVGSMLSHRQPEPICSHCGRESLGGITPFCPYCKTEMKEKPVYHEV